MYKTFVIDHKVACFAGNSDLGIIDLVYTLHHDMCMITVYTHPC